MEVPMFDKIKAKIEELKAEIESVTNAEELKADEAALGLLQGWTDGLTALKRVLEDKEKPAESEPQPVDADGKPILPSETPPVPVESAPSEPAQEAKGDAAESAEHSAAPEEARP
jgi:hypothetical protein